MRILITNDDGIFAPGIKAVADAAIERGHDVIICAPVLSAVQTVNTLRWIALCWCGKFPGMALKLLL